MPVFLIMLSLPKDYTPSKKVEPGESFEVIAEVRRTEDGGFYLSKVDGQAFDEEKEEPEEEEDEKSFDDMVAMPTDRLRS